MALAREVMTVRVWPNGEAALIQRRIRSNTTANLLLYIQEVDSRATRKKILARAALFLRLNSLEALGQLGQDEPAWI